MKTLEEYLNYIESIHPDEIDMGLQRVGAVYQRLFPNGLPYKVITIAGTNGKGSTGALISNALSSLDVSYGWFSSPHILRFNERFVINDIEASDEEIITAFNSIEALRGEITLSYFEYATLIAVVLFATKNVQVTVMEVGLGGRLDSTNILAHDISIITSIGLDHTEYLGDTLEQIAYEKSGIMRVHTPVIIPSTIHPEVVRLAHEYQAIVHSCTPLELELMLLGKWQQYNASLAYTAVELICEMIDITFDTSVVLEALAHTTLHGRSERIEYKNTSFIVDTAHNTHAIECLATILPPRNIAIFSVFADKDYENMIRVLRPYVEYWILIDGGSTRNLAMHDAQQSIWAIYDECKPQHQHGHENASSSVNIACCKSSEEAVDLAVKHPVHDVLVFGSFTTIGAILPVLLYN